MTRDCNSASVRYGYLPAREIQTCIEPVSVLPSSRTNEGKRVTFRSVLDPPFLKKELFLKIVLAILFLNGVFSVVIEEALEVMVGP